MADQKTLTAKPLQFTMWELFVLVSLVGVTAGFFSLARVQPANWMLPFFFALLATIGFTLSILTRWSILVVTSVTLLFAFVASVFLNGHSIEDTRRYICSNQLKHIGIALQNYHDTFGSLPPAYIADANGKPIHSWRVLILPFLENRALYDKYRFDEPWDGPNNRKLHGEILNVYRCPRRNPKQRATETSYVAVIGPQTMWPGAKSTLFTDLTDGTPNTIMVVEMAHSGIHWMEPRDLDMATMPLTINPPKSAGISSAHPNIALAVFADGHTAALTNKTPAKTIEALLTIAGGETIDPDF